MQSSNLVRIALRIRSQALPSRYNRTNIIANAKSSPVVRSAAFSSWLEKITGGSSATDEVSTETSSTPSSSTAAEDVVKVEKVKVAACGDIDSDEDDEMEQEEMFVSAYASSSFDHGAPEWGGPRRGGRLLEPTRFGDWERKGRCSDF